VLNNGNILQWSGWMSELKNEKVFIINHSSI
jgi:hypothetical protein